MSLLLFIAFISQISIFPLTVDKAMIYWDNGIGALIPSKPNFKIIPELVISKIKNLLKPKNLFFFLFLNCPFTKENFFDSSLINQIFIIILDTFNLIA